MESSATLRFDTIKQARLALEQFEMPYVRKYHSESGNFKKISYTCVGPPTQTETDLHKSFPTNKVPSCTIIQ
jgi:hypothetical protein